MKPTLVITTAQYCKLSFIGENKWETELDIKEAVQKQYPDLLIKTDENYFYNFTIEHKSDTNVGYMNIHENIMLAAGMLLNEAKARGLVLETV